MPHIIRTHPHLWPLLGLAIMGSLCGCQDEPPAEPVEEVPCGVVSQTSIDRVNDTGTPCDPQGGLQTSCNHHCLSLESGERVCVDTCEDESCPEGYRCNTLPWDEKVCLPNLSCGDLTYEGRCEGSAVVYCASEGIDTYDCSESWDEDFEPMVCGWIEGLGNDCVSSSDLDTCADIPDEGLCEGSVFTDCGPEGPGVRDCSQTVDGHGEPMVCDSHYGIPGCVSSNPQEACAQAPGLPFDIPDEGSCIGLVFFYCGPEGLVIQDCSETLDDNDEPMLCAWIDGSPGCVSSSVLEPCGDLTAWEAVCSDQDTQRVCLDTGKVVEVDCAAHGFVCSVDEFDSAECLPEDGGDCDTDTYTSHCKGNIVVDCSMNKFVESSCAAVGLACYDISWGDGGAACMPEPSEACGDANYLGYCDGDTLIYCDGEQLEEIDCAVDGFDFWTCWVNESGRADCGVDYDSLFDDDEDSESDDGGDCGDVTYLGYCDGDTVVYCFEDELNALDCTDDGQVCAYEDDVWGFNCLDVPPEPTSTPMTITASYHFEKPELTSAGLGEISQVPVRQALVTLMQASDDKEVGRSFTDEDGSVSITFDTAEPSCYLLLRAVGDGQTHAFSVRDCPLADCEPKLGNAYGHQSEPFSLDPGGTTLAPMVITVASGVAGAFNIFDLLVRGAAFVSTNLGTSPGAHTVQWKAGSTTVCDTSCYWKNTLYLRSTDADTDEFDDPVVLHEYGHFLEDVYSKRDSPGGDHDGSPTNPLLAWGEGYGTYAGCAIADSSLYIDTMVDATDVVDINADGLAGYPGQLDHPKGMRQTVSEYLVAEILWKLSRGYKHQGTPLEGKTDAPIFDVLRAYFVSPLMADRGVKGIDLVDFLDGWFWRGHGDTDFIEGLVGGLAKFPYDFGGPTYCEEAPTPSDSTQN